MMHSGPGSADWERTERTLLSETLAPELRVVEVGTGTGRVSATIHACAHLLATYEPHPDLFFQAARILAPFGIPVHWAAVGGRVGWTTLRVNDEWWNSSLSAHDGPYGTVERDVIVPLIDGPTLLARTPPMNALVIDAEGAEIDILDSLLHTHLEQLEYLAIEWHPTRIACPSLILDHRLRLLALGFREERFVVDHITQHGVYRR